MAPKRLFITLVAANKPRHCLKPFRLVLLVNLYVLRCSTVALLSTTPLAESSRESMVAVWGFGFKRLVFMIVVDVVVQVGL